MTVKRVPACVAATVALVAAVASCGIGSGDPVAQRAPASGATAVAPVASPRVTSEAAKDGASCALRNVDLSLGEFRDGGHTGERSFALRLTNNGPRSCVLDGRPSIGFLDADGKSILHEDENGGGRQYVHGIGSTATQLRPGSSAEVVIAKYRCDAGDDARAAQIKVGLPGAAETVTLSSEPNVVAVISACRGGADDPAQTFAVSGYTPLECRLVGNATGGGWCDGDLDRPFTQTAAESAHAAQKKALARQYVESKTG